MIELASHVTLDIESCGRCSCMRDTRVGGVLDLRVNSPSFEVILGEMLYLELKDTRASLKFASKQLNHRINRCLIVHADAQAYSYLAWLLFTVFSVEVLTVWQGTRWPKLAWC
jgi:hypothetical protein